jgi:hypothetical protein
MTKQPRPAEQPASAVGCRAAKPSVSVLVVGE